MTKLPFDRIKVRPWPLSVLPPMERAGTTIYPNIWVGRALYMDLQLREPSPYNVALIKHEQVHLRRMEDVGVRRWYFLYIFSRKFRYQEELAGIKVQISYLLSHGATFDADHFAQSLSGFAYLWPVSRERARKDVGALIEQLRV